MSAENGIGAFATGNGRHVVNNIRLTITILRHVIDVSDGQRLFFINLPATLYSHRTHRTGVSHFDEAAAFSLIIGMAVLDITHDNHRVEQVGQAVLHLGVCRIAEAGRGVDGTCAHIIIVAVGLDLLRILIIIELEDYWRN